MSWNPDQHRKKVEDLGQRLDAAWDAFSRANVQYTHACEQTDAAGEAFRRAGEVSPPNPQIIGQAAVACAESVQRAIADGESMRVQMVAVAKLAVEAIELLQERD